MTERPILFSGGMVRAIRTGHKTQTRRIGKWQNDTATELGVEYAGHATRGTVAQATYRAFPKGGTARHALCECPYGVPSDRLWVRETWRPQDGMTMECRHADEIEYRATDDRPKEPTDCHWKPSIFMPRWASRITLEITRVRVERVQEISEADAMAEGYFGDGLTDYGRKTMKPLSWFWAVWDRINAKRGFGRDKNPWVWVLTFRVIANSEVTSPNGLGSRAAKGSGATTEI